MNIPRVILTATVAFGAFAAQAPRPQKAPATIRVTETAGIRRFNYPVSARVHLPKGILGDSQGVRMTLDEKEQPTQFTAETRWSDGSVEWLDADFNLNAAPLQTQLLHLEYGSDVKTAIPKGLALSEDSTSIQAGSIRLGKTGKPLLASVKYRGEDIGHGFNTLAVADASGAIHDLSDASALETEIVKRGPLLIVVRYTGRLALDAGYSVAFTVTAEVPNSKSMVRISATFEDPAHRVREISLHTPLAFGALPWVWDFGTGRWTYGPLRSPADSVTLGQTLTTAGLSRWSVSTGAPGKQELYEQSSAGRAEPVRWGHFQDGKEVVAFLLDMAPHQTGAWKVTLDGEGHVAYRYAPPSDATRPHFAVDQHFVNTPVQIGAATSPASLLTPLAVAVIP